MLKSPKSNLPEITTKFDTVSGWFKDSATILVARTVTAGGFITGVMGSLNWSPLLGLTEFKQAQVIGMAAVVLLIGISTEVARRRTLNA